MRINCHSHVFNLKSIFTLETLNILINRLTNEGVPDFLVVPLAKIFKNALKEEDYINRRVLLGQLAKEITKNENFKHLLEDISIDRWPVDVKLVVDGDVAALGIEILEGFFEGVAKLLHQSHADAREVSLSDYLEFIYIGLAPDIDTVTNTLFEQLEDEDIIVPLVMDITTGNSDDEILYKSQLKNTARQILRFPGRILPFAKVNPKRTNHFPIMKEALTDLGFIGVKLYPSLGYKVDNKKMKTVLKYLDENDIPVLQHCTARGFYKKREFTNYCQPKHWRPLLGEFKKLKVCFGHFGGDGNLAQESIPGDSWTKTILDMMKEFKDRVFADISFHTHPMTGAGKEKQYFSNLKEILNDPIFGRQVLWGTDYFLVRMRLRESSYWSYFEQKMSKTAFRKIATINPVRFLGLPDNNGIGKNIERYVNFIAKNQDFIEGEPAKWLLSQIKKSNKDLVNSITAYGNRWTVNNRAHVFVYKYLKRSQFTPLLKESVKFASAGGVTLKKLSYWRPPSTPVEIKEGLILSLAESFNDVCVYNGATYEDGYHASKAIIKLKELLNKGDTTLADLAELVDKIYKFSWEADII